MVLTRRDKTTPTANQDIELRGLSHSNDPFSLTSFLKSDAEITAAKANTSRPRTGLKTWFPKKNSKNVSKFYESQNDIIRSFLKTVDEHEQEAQDTHGNTNRRYKIAVWGSLIANFILAGLQLYGAISSGSLSLYTTMIDSIFDPVSGVLLLLSHRAVKRVNLHKYPSGRARVSTAGNIVFSFLMFSVSLVLIVMSIRDLASGHGDTGKETKKFNYPSIIAVGIAFVTKLALFFYCWSLKGIYSQVEILWKDHRNDSIINAFGIMTSVGGSKLRWFIDPMGALILSLLISFLWLKTAFEEFQLLIGVSADADMQRLITYVGSLSPPPLYPFIRH